VPAPRAAPSAVDLRTRLKVVSALGFTQIFAWGSSYYLPAVLAGAITADVHISLATASAGIAIGLLVAGIVSPRVGLAINRRGGRPLLALSSVVLGCGLIVLGSAQALVGYISAWLVMGVGMGAGLYDAAFATLGRLYGREARSAISALTLIAGFSSTICWPLSAFLLDQFGWRTTCFCYAALQIVVALPIHLWALPSCASAMPAAPAHSKTVAGRGVPSEQRHLFLILALTFTIAGVISAIVSVHIFTILEASGATPGRAVMLGTLVGPAQVGARLCEVLWGRRYRALWTLAGSAALSAAGLALLLIDAQFAVLAVVLYGAGTGIGWIARGTVPLEVFGPDNYAALLGRLAAPSTIAQALAPLLGAVLLEAGGPRLTLAILSAMALAAGLLTFELFRKSSPTSPKISDA
jgi:MFS family permease